MKIYQINSEWDLGISDFYTTAEAAWAAIEKALPAVGLTDPMQEYVDENLISVEEVFVRD